MLKPKIPSVRVFGVILTVPLLIALIAVSADDWHPGALGVIGAILYLVATCAVIGREIRAKQPERRAIAAERSAEIARQRRR